MYQMYLDTEYKLYQEYRCKDVKIFKKILSNYIQHCMKKLCIITNWDLFQLCESDLTFKN